jgi:TolA-binding protein
MLTKNLKSKLQKAIAGLSVSGLVLAGIIAAVPTSAAYAAPATPPAQGQTEQTRNARLEQAYQREQKWLGTQQDNLNKMNNVADKVQQFITTQQGKGKDVTALQDALATFKSQITAAQASHMTAADVLSTHLGFDASGHVTDLVQARQTLLDARQSLRDAHDVMRQAVLDLHRAIRAWRQVNGPQATKATPTPNSNG